MNEYRSIYLALKIYVLEKKWKNPAAIVRCLAQINEMRIIWTFCPLFAHVKPINQCSEILLFAHNKILFLYKRVVFNFVRALMVLTCNDVLWQGFTMKQNQILHHASRLSFNKSNYTLNICTTYRRVLCCVKPLNVLPFIINLIYQTWNITVWHYHIAIFHVGYIPCY